MMSRLFLLRIFRKPLFRPKEVSFLQPAAQNNTFREYLALFHNKDFALLWTGLLISRLGDWFTSIGLIWFVLQVTGSTAATSVVIFSSTILAVVTGPFVGIMLDRYSSRTLLLFDNIVRGLMLAVIPTLYYLHTLSLPVICVLISIHGMMAPITDAGSRMLLPKLLDERQLVKANTLDIGMLYGTMLVAPILSGLLVNRVGAVNVLFLDSLSFFLFAFLLVFFRKEQWERKETQQSVAVFQQFVQGLRYIGKSQPIMGLCTLFFIINVTTGPLLIILPDMVKSHLHAGADAFGMFFTAMAAGSLIGSSIAGLLKREVPLGWGILVSAFGMGLPLLLMAWFSDSLPMLLLLMAVHGFFNAPMDIYSVTLRQRLVEKNMQGQVFAATMTVNKSGDPLGTLLAGNLMQVMAVPHLMFGMGALFMIGILLSMMIRGFRNARAPVEQSSVSA